MNLFKCIFMNTVSYWDLRAKEIGISVQIFKPPSSIIGGKCHLTKREKAMWN